jgi:membrane protein
MMTASRLMKSKSMLFLGDLAKVFGESQLSMVASSLAYTTILSIIPVLAMGFSVFKAFGGMEKLYESIEPIILQNLTEGASGQTMQTIRGFIENIHAGALGAVGLIGVIVTCMSMLLSIEKAINRIWKTQIQRTIFQRISYYWLIITLGPLALSFVIGLASTQGQSIIKYLPSQAGAITASTVLFLLIYKGVPNRPVHWVPAIVSSFIASLAWNLGRVAYASYTAKVLTYNKIYGSLSAVPILFVWIYIGWLIILSGAAITSVLQRKYEP